MVTPKEIIQHFGEDPEEMYSSQRDDFEGLSNFTDRINEEDPDFFSGNFVWAHYPNPLNGSASLPQLLDSVSSNIEAMEDNYLASRIEKRELPW